MTRTKRVLTLLMLAAVLVGLFPMPAKAAYENTYENTGNYRQDLIGVALTQVGYQEGGSNYTKYGVWFGYPYEAWCGMFISWCANQAGIPTSVIPRNGLASPGGFGISDYFRGSERTPQPGDLFFRKNADGYWVHAGIVWKIEDGDAVTIEGNTYTSYGQTEGVYIRYRSLSGENYYFGSPNYGDGYSHTHTYGSATFESEHPHREYQICTASNCGYKRYSGVSATVDGCQDCCDHNFGAWSANGSRHQRTCSKCDYTQKEDHSWGNDEILRYADCKQTGSKRQTCRVCAATQTVTISKTDDHDFTPWELVDENAHTRTCQVCSLQEEDSHDAHDDWSTDEKEHWHQCADCEGKPDIAPHEFGENCQDPCAICGYVRQTGHIFSQERQWNEEEHYFQCENCPEKQDVTPHTIGTQLASDEKGHFYPCTDCGYQSQQQAHLHGPAATEESNQVCTVCSFEIAPKLEHQHWYLPMEYDWQMHWGTCRCGHEYAPAVHIWDAETHLCMVCRQPVMEPPQERVWDQVAEAIHWQEIVRFVNWEQNQTVILIGGGVLLLVLLTTVVTVVIVRKKKAKRLLEV